MAMSTLNAPHFQDPNKAREFLENLRWNGEPVCPHCGTVGKAYETQKAGVYRCGSKECRKDFTVTTKSVMKSSHIKLHIWLQAFHYMSAGKDMSAYQLHRMLGCTYKTAWFLAHRIREAMRTGGLAPMGGAGQIVEIDETKFGKLAGSPKRLRRWRA
jgi:transposase-like protein